MEGAVTTLLTVYCGQCVEAKRKAVRSRPSRLGSVEREVNGRLIWVTEAHSTWPLVDGPEARPTGIFRTFRRPVPRRITLETPERSHRKWVPDVLPATCRHHGRGGVSLHDVLGKQGTVTLKMISQATHG